MTVENSVTNCCCFLIHFYLGVEIFWRFWCLGNILVFIPNVLWPTGANTLQRPNTFPFQANKCANFITPKHQQPLRSQPSASLFSVPISIVFWASCSVLYLQRFFCNRCTCVVKLVKLFFHLYVFWKMCVFIFISFLNVQRVSPNVSVLGCCNVFATIQCITNHLYTLSG